MFFWLSFLRLLGLCGPFSRPGLGRLARTAASKLMWRCYAWVPVEAPREGPSGSLAHLQWHLRRVAHKGDPHAGGPGDRSFVGSTRSLFVFFPTMAPKTMKNKGFHLQKNRFLGSKNKVFDGFGGPW